MSYREIGNLIGVSHPQTVKHHLEQLEKRNLIRSNAEGTSITKTSRDPNIAAIPIFGSANCGPATVFAEENIQGYLRVSAKIIAPKPGLYALRAVGDSMNRANIKGKSIEDRDYAIVDSTQLVPQNRDYVVSVIGGTCNIKKFLLDKTNRQVVLLSESSEDFPPIYIHPEEVDYLVCGKVVDVIKTPPLT